MGFFSNIFNRGKAYTDKSIAPAHACEMEIDGKKHLLLEFDMDFSTATANRYIPMYAVFADKISPELESWITRSSKRKDGIIKFFRNSDNLSEGAVFTLSFSDAVCKSYKKSTRGDNPVTTLVLAAKHIKLQDEEFLMN
ncbi:type VI secretion system tube protein TssD [Bacteroides sp. 224]|uniref:type VI secretion system tube protein TssD n=1 Tax=Bacteroides sp. 224 TaxID=2302936 RepID=UPI0013D27C16|nr:type VI secretion system tube protein TssD [Bacteroides sp. 224]NDV64650.1 hypothetical protein [Bacteroides sp. 224]